MALSSSKIALLAEAVRETSTVVVAAIASRSLNTAELSLLSSDAELYESARNSFVKVKGDGIDFDNARKREAIYYRVRQLLGLPFVVLDLSVELMELVELEVGQNFG